MRLKKKIKNDNFITLDYERIRQEVRENIKTIESPKNTIFHKHLKYGIISLSLLIVILVGVIFIPKIVNNLNQETKPENYLCYEAAAKRKVKYSETREEGYLEFLEKLDTFSLKISTEIYNKYKDENENYIISPISLYMGLAMLVESTVGEAREEILNALGMTYEEVSKYTSILYSKMNDIGGQTDRFGKTQITYEEIMTNSIWIENSIELKEEGLLKLANNYHCSSFSVPFNKENKKANETIKNYVSECTKGLINQDFNLKKDIIFALINTYYLKDLWNYEGDELQFTNEQYLFNEKIKKYLLEGYYVIGKPYETNNSRHFYTVASNGTKLKFIVPKDGYNISDIYNFETLKNINNISSYSEIDHEKKETHYTRCLFPEFEANFDDYIESVYMKTLGINKVFTHDNSFIPLTDNSAVLSYVQHVSKIKVDKKGIEGAAVTVEPGKGTSMPPDDYERVNHEFIVDRNFIVIITDANNVTLFSGVIYNVK